MYSNSDSAKAVCDEGDQYTKIPNKNCQQKIVNILQNFGVCNLKLTWHVALIYKSLFEKLVECPDLLFDAVWVHGNVGVFPIGHHTP